MLDLSYIGFKVVKQNEGGELIKVKPFTHSCDKLFYRLCAESTDLLENPRNTNAREKSTTDMFL